MKISRNSRFVNRFTDEGLIALDPVEGNLYTLNPVASRIWRYLWKTRSMKEISNKIVKEFNIPLDRVKKDVEGFVEKSLKEGLLLKT